VPNAFGASVKAAARPKNTVDQCTRADIHAKVLRHLDCTAFCKAYPIEAMRVHRQLRPKPPDNCSENWSQKNEYAGRCILVEDTIGTLKAAKPWAGTTVWVTRYLLLLLICNGGWAYPALPKLSKRPVYVESKKSIRHYRSYASFALIYSFSIATYF